MIVTLSPLNVVRANPFNDDTNSENVTQLEFSNNTISRKPSAIKPNIEQGIQITNLVSQQTMQIIENSENNPAEITNTPHIFNVVGAHLQ